MRALQRIRKLKYGGMAENVWLALDTLRNNKLRSALTLVSITVAVTTLIAVVALLMGLDKNVQDSIQSYGTNTAFFDHLPDGPRFGRLSKEERERKPLSFEDFEAIQESCPSCRHVTVSLFNDRLNTARYKGEEVSGLDYRGTTSDFFSVYANAVVVKGRAFTETENAHRMALAVIGEDLANGLYGREDPIGKPITVDGHEFTVLGVFEKPKGGLGGPGNSDNRVVTPYWTFRKMHPNAKHHGIRVEAMPGKLDVAVDETRLSLRRTRKVPYNKPDNFSYSTAESLVRNFHQIVGIVGLAVMVIASVGLMIGGIGVMNIMLVSVTERTREIGVRKAIGARRRDIIGQFITEAMVMAATGGIAGVSIGFLISGAVHAAVESLPTYVPVWAVVMGVGVAASVGLFFGIYPAVKASRLDPVEALRYE
jgi:putative ABC transport system permease protein